MNIQYIVITILCFLLPLQVQARNEGSAIGNVSVKLVKKNKTATNRVNIEHIKYELSINLNEILVNRNGIITSEIQNPDSMYKREIHSTISSEPNTIKNISTTSSLDYTGKQKNKPEYTDIVLKNDKGDTLKARITLNTKKITFDEYGNGNLDIKSNFFFDKKKAKGTYRSFYYIIMSH